MHTLFDISPTLPPGFHYETNFITEAEEILLLDLIKSLELNNMKFHQYEAKRKVISFGQGWSFTEQRLKQGEPIPAGFNFLVERVARKLNLAIDRITQFLVTE